MEAKQILVRSWLAKAQRDLESARRLSTGPEPALLDTAIYHCQQAAEKAIKGFLVLHDQRFEKSHDIRLLVALALPLEPGFEGLWDAAERLTPYATIYRYPGEVAEPTRSEFDRAREAADAVYQFVLSRVPPEVRP